MASAGRILMFPVGDWILGNDYGILDIVYHEGSSYIAKNNILNSTTPPPDDPTNWQIHARGFGADALSEISAEDTSGVLGTVGAVVASQSLIDALAAKVMTELIPYTNIANNFLATDPKTVLSGPMGKSLKDQLDTTNSNLSVIGTLQSKTGNSNTIAPNSMQWMCDWFTITAGTYLMGFNSVNTTNVDTYLKLSDSQPIMDVNPRELLCANSGSAVKVVTITSDKWVSVLINNHSASNYTVFADPSAFFAWTLRIK